MIFTDWLSFLTSLTRHRLSRHTRLRHRRQRARRGARPTIDFLATEALEARVMLAGAVGEVTSFTKISDTAGNFPAILEDGDGFGVGVTELGDLDGDGINDIAVGAWDDDDGGDDRGAVYVLFLNADGTVKTHQKISDTEGNFTATLEDGDRFGTRLTNLGDLDGDGVADLAVGARRDDDGGVDRGAVYVLFLNTDGTVKSHQKISDTEGNLAAGLDEGGHFGISLANLGDLNSDGITDLAVGAHSDNDGGTDRGAVYVLFLNADGTVKSHQKISNTEASFAATLDDHDKFGVGLAELGDLDGDGVVDLAVGTEGDDDGGGGRGAVYVLFLNPNGTVKSHQKISDTEGNFTAVLGDGDTFGIELANLGDLDADGVIDLAVGAYRDGDQDRGAVYVLFMNADGTVKSHQEISDTQGNFTGVLEGGDNFGVSVDILGDLNGDGSTELVVGAYGDGDGGSNRGAVYILHLVGGEQPDAVIIDDGDAGYADTGNWGVSSVEGRDGDVRYAAGGNGSRVATYEFTGLTPGANYAVAATWTTHANRATNAPYTILDSDGVSILETTLVNQEMAPNDFSADDSDWERLGIVTVSGSTLTIQLSNAANQYVIADAIRVVETQQAPPEVVIIDDGEDGFAATAGWKLSASEGRQNDVHYRPGGGGAEVATWTFTNLEPGHYRVSATWTAHANRATNAPFTILDGSGGTALATSVIDQEMAPDELIANGSDWEDLAVVTITGSELVVELSNAANGYVIADAIRIERSLTPPPPPEYLIIDDGDTGYTDTGWAQSPVMEGRLSDLRYAPAGNGSQTATWTFTGLTPGNYAVAATWKPHANRATNAPFTIYDGIGGGVLEMVHVNQEIAPADFNAHGSDWQDLTIVTISGTELVVELSNDANQYVIADAIRIAATTVGPALPPGTIIDDGDADFTTTPTGWSTSLAEGRDGDIRYAASGGGSRIATWTFTGLEPGTYRVSATWSPHANRATDAPFTILNGATPLDTVDVNQQATPDDFRTLGSDWEDLGDFFITGDTLVVQLSNAAGGFVIADAIRIQATEGVNPIFSSETGHFYEFVPTSPDITWNESRDAAAARSIPGSSGEDLQGYLATITSALEQDFLVEHFGSINDVWIGGNDLASEGQWRWVTGPEGEADGGLGLLFWDDGTAVGYSNWRSGEPNNLGDEDYLTWNHRSGGWNDSLLQSRDGVSGYFVEYGGEFDDQPLPMPTVIDLASLDGDDGFRLDGGAEDDFSGTSVSSAGDINGDGFDDVIIGARGADAGGDASGAAHVVFGAAGGFAASIELESLDGTNGFRLVGTEGERAGISVSGAGDVNGDGFDDLIVGAYGADPNGQFSGSSYVVFGHSGPFAASFDLQTLDGTNGFRLDGAGEEDAAGYSVSGAGDVNGDGFDDLIIGA